VVGIELDPVAAALVVGDRRSQLGHARQRRVLVGPPGAHRNRDGIGDLVRAVGVGKALSEIQRAGAQGERRHLGEDRRAEGAQAACGHGAMMTAAHAAARRARRDGAGASTPRGSAR